LAYLAALVLSEGRGARSLALAVAEVFANSENSVEAAAAFKTLLGGEGEEFTAVVALAGVKSFHDDVKTYGCEPIGDPIEWPGGNTARSGKPLREFVDRHLGRASAAVFVTVDALDFEHARRLARETVESLQDQLAAEHRTAKFSMKEVSVVRRRRDSRVMTVREPTPAPVAIARPRARAGLPELERSMRFHRLACSADSPVLAVAQTWIALEHLARGASRVEPARRGRNAKRIDVKPAVFLPQHVATTAYLAAARESIMGCWHLVRREAERTAPDRWQQLTDWLGQRRGLHTVNPDRWLALLQEEELADRPTNLPRSATQSEAAAYLWETLDGCSTFVRIRAEDTAKLVRNPARLSFVAARAELRAQANVSRIHL